MVDAVLVGARGATMTNTVSTTAGSVTTGETLVAVVSYDPGTTITSIADTALNTYSLISNQTGGAGRLAMYRCENATGHASNVLTVNFSGTAFPTAHLIKITGGSSAPYDSGSMNSAVDANNATPYEITSGTLAQADSVVIACAEINNGGSNGDYSSTNFTLLSSEGIVASFWTSGVFKLVVAATTAVTPSMTRSGQSNGPTGMIVAAFKGLVVGASGSVVSGTPQRNRRRGR